MVETAEAFGFDQPPSLAAPEALGGARAARPRAWARSKATSRSARASIGQGQVLATPLQMASVAQTIANDGVRLPTSIVKNADLRPDDEPVEVTSPGDGQEGRGHDARGRPLGHRHRRPDPRDPGRRQDRHGRDGPAGARARTGSGARRGPAAGRERLVRLLRARRQARARDRGDARSTQPAAAARSRRRSRADLLVRRSGTEAASLYSSSSAGKPITEPITTRTPPATAIRPPTVS